MMTNDDDEDQHDDDNDGLSDVSDVDDEFGDEEEEARREEERESTIRAISWAYCNLGVLFHRQERLDDALDAYTSSLEWDPDCSNALSNRGQAYARAGKYGDAAKDFGRAASKREGDVDLQKSLVMALHADGQLEAMRTYIRTIIPKLAPDARGWAVSCRNPGVGGWADVRAPLELMEYHLAASR